MKKLCLLTTASLLTFGALASNSLLAQADHANMPMPADSKEANSAETVQGRGTVQKVEEESRKVTLVHEAIPEWQWPAMTMAFDVAESVDISILEEGTEIEFSVARPEGGGQVLTEIRLLEE